MPRLPDHANDGSTVGVGLGPRNRINEADRQAALDAAAVLQLHRSEIAARAARGESAEVEIVAVGNSDITAWILEAAFTWRDLCSIRPAATAPQLRVSLPLNRLLLGGGARMTSLFDADGVDLDARLLLANEPVGDYRFTVAPVQMKIVDRRAVLLQGPFLDGVPSLMSVTAPACVEAAWRYWDAAVGCSFPVRDDSPVLGDLTPRQRQIVGLLNTGLADAAIAESLGVSTRTVRSDIAAMLETLGVRSRFAAGARLNLWPGADD